MTASPMGCEALLAAKAVVANWMAAFAECNVDAIAQLYSEDALFVGTGSTTLVDCPHAIRGYFLAAFVALEPRDVTLVDHRIVVLSPSTVLVTGVDSIGGRVGGEPTRWQGRVSFLIVERDGVWKIVHFHRSAMPV